MKRIPLRDRTGKIKRWTLVDDEDYDRLMVRRWQATRGKKDRTWYATAHVRFSGATKPVHTGMHRVIMNAPKGKVVDHINGNGLDNRKKNLRLCTNAENNRNRRSPPSNNTSGYTGVTWNKKRKAWAARVELFERDNFLGYFTDKKEAARVAKEFRKKNGFSR